MGCWAALGRLVHGVGLVDPWQLRAQWMRLGSRIERLMLAATSDGVSPCSWGQAMDISPGAVSARQRWWVSNLLFDACRSVRFRGR